MLNHRLEDHQNLSVVYRIYSGNWTLYVGHCPIAGFATLIDARWNPEVAALLNNAAMTISGEVEIISLMKTESLELFNFHADMQVKSNALHKRVKRPESKKGRATQKVIHNETGTIYESAAEAAREWQIAPSQLSNHLNGMGSKTVKGQSFRYVEC